MRFLAVAILYATTLTGCASSHPPDRSYRNHVSDIESERRVQGVTYDSGPAHPTFWEMAFARLGIK